MQKVLNSVLDYKNLYIYQSPESFCFSIDAVILADFVKVADNSKICDLGTGNGIIPILLSRKTTTKIIGVEIQTDIYKMASDSIAYNNLESQVELLNTDIKSIKDYVEFNTYDIVISNPPYFKVDKDSKLNASDFKTIARHEVKINLEEIIKISSKMLKPKGIFYVVIDPQRSIELFNLLRVYKLEPKTIRYVYPKLDKTANHLLVEAIKSGKPGVNVLPPLIIHNQDGSYSDTIKEMFQDKRRV